MPSTRVWGFILSCVLIFALAFQLLAPRLIASRIHHIVQSNCAECQIEIGKVEFNLLENFVRVHQIRFMSERGKRTEVSVTAASIAARFPWSQILRATPTVSDVRIEAPHVIVAEYPRVASKDTEPDRIPKYPKFEVMGVRCDDGIFDYEKFKNGKVAKIHASDIRARVGNLGTTYDLIRRPAVAQVMATVQGEGKLDLRIRSDIFSRSRNTWIDVAVSDVNLAAMDSYFTPADGIHLKGKLEHASAQLHLVRDIMSGTMEMNYKKLSISFHETKDRGAFQTLVANLGADLKLNETDLDRSKRQREKPVRAKRQDDESLVKFVLRGLRDSTLQIVTS